jgi:hypothetical protein
VDEIGRAPVVIEKPPLPIWSSAGAVARCAVNTAVLLAQRRLHLSKDQVGEVLQFADGTTSWVYRETVVDRAPTADPAVLVVGFRLRAVRGRGHALFRPLSLLNTPLFVGFPGFVSKLWMAHDSNGVYRGVYEWDGPVLAENYARALWRVLALVSVPGTIHYQIVPGLHRDELLDRPRLGEQLGMQDWSRPAQALANVG